MKGLSVQNAGESFHQALDSEQSQVPKAAAKKKFASKMRSIVSAVKTAQRLEVRPCFLSDYIKNQILAQQQSVPPLSNIYI